MKEEQEEKRRIGCKEEFTVRYKVKKKLGLPPTDVRATAPRYLFILLG
jgi:hypothetical protein